MEMYSNGEKCVCVCECTGKRKGEKEKENRMSGNGIKRNCRIYLTKRKIKRINVI